MAIMEISAYWIFAASQKKIKTIRIINKYGKARLKKPRNQNLVGFNMGCRHAVTNASATSTLIVIKICFVSFLKLKVIETGCYKREYKYSQPHEIWLWVRVVFYGI